MPGSTNKHQHLEQISVLSYNNYNQDKTDSDEEFWNDAVKSGHGRVRYLHCVQRMSHNHTRTSCRQKTKKTDKKEKISLQNTRERKKRDKCYQETVGGEAGFAVKSNLLKVE